MGAAASKYLPSVADRGVARDAQVLMDRSGSDSGLETAGQADANRRLENDRGNTSCLVLLWLLRRQVGSEGS